jgi:4-hydroxybenzoate polyprenyltransferase
MSGTNETVARRSFASRFIEYQRERFPFLQHGLLIVTFTFSAASYPRICRGAPGFIPLGEFIAGAVTSLLFFFLLRIFDEFKDAEDDARYRPYRPVPRGLVTLRELAVTGFVVTAVQIALNLAVMPGMLIAWGIVIGYMLLMWREFFVAEWLKRRPILYMLTHMAVMPLIDFYTTGLGWLNAGALPPRGLEFFLTVTFLNGIVIEVGRKIRAAEQEETGVETYSALYGARRATLGWIGVILLTWLSAVLAAFYAGFGGFGIASLTGFLLLCSAPALLFLRSGSPRHAKLIETAAGIWTIAMYLTLGAAPMLIEMFGGR